MLSIVNTGPRTPAPRSKDRDQRQPVLPIANTLEPSPGWWVACHAPDLPLPETLPWLLPRLSRWVHVLPGCSDARSVFLHESHNLGSVAASRQRMPTLMMVGLPCTGTSTGSPHNLMTADAVLRDASRQHRISESRRAACHRRPTCRQVRDEMSPAASGMVLVTGTAGGAAEILSLRVQCSPGSVGGTSSMTTYCRTPSRTRGATMSRETAHAGILACSFSLPSACLAVSYSARLPRRCFDVLGTTRRASWPPIPSSGSCAT